VRLIATDTVIDIATKAVNDARQFPRLHRARHQKVVMPHGDGHDDPHHHRDHGESTIPAIASGRPRCQPPVALILTTAMIPKITLSGTQLTKPSTSAAIAQPLVERRGGCWYGGPGRIPVPVAVA
jgi:hypothetical protein